MRAHLALQFITQPHGQIVLLLGGQVIRQRFDVHLAAHAQPFALDVGQAAIKHLHMLLEAEYRQLALHRAHAAGRRLGLRLKQILVTQHAEHRIRHHRPVARAQLGVGAVVAQ